MTATGSVRKPLLALLVGALIALPVVGATAAQAHDVLQSTDPADGSTVALVPDHVTLTFDEPALVLGTEITVQDPNQQTVSVGPPVLVDNTVSQEVTGALPAGVYTVLYRVTSADGHPIAGTFTFTATGETSYGVATQAPTMTASAAPTPTSSAEVTASPSPSASGASDERAVSAGPLIGIAAVLVVAGGIVAWLLLRRRPAS